MPGATTRTNTRATVLSDEELRLMASLPGIEVSVVEILKTLAAFVSESADRETRLNKRVDELSRQLKDVNEELVSLRESAIALRKATPRPVQTQQGTGADQPSRRRTKAGSAGTGTRKHDTTMSRSVPSNISRSGDECEEDGSVPCNISLSSDECEGDGDQDAIPTKSQTDVTESKPIFHVIEDDSWKLVSSERPKNKRAVVYVGNIATDSTDSHFRQFIKTRSEFLGASIPVHTCSIWLSESGRAFARVTIDATSLSTVTAPNFWPRPVYCRPWRFLETSSEGSTSSRSHSSRNSTSASVLTKQQQQQQQPGSTSSSSPPPPPPPPPPPADFISTPLHSSQKRRNSHLSPPEAGDLKRSNGSAPQHDQHDAQPPQQDAQSSHAQ